MRRAGSLALAAPVAWHAAAVRPSRPRGRALGWCLGLLVSLAAAGARAQDDVPFITTPDHVTLAMLELAEVRAGEFLIDLGSGDGRIVVTAARRFGARGLGVELVPELVAQSRRHAQAAGVAASTEFRVQDLFDTDLRQAQVLTMYLLPEVNLQLRPRLLLLAPGTRIVSHDWTMGDWLPDRSLTLAVPEKSIGLDKRSTLHLWVVPARVHGLWCTAGGALQLTQRFQRFSAVLTAPALNAPLQVFDGHVGATRLQAGGGVTGPTAVFDLRDGGLRLSQSSGPAARFAGQQFMPAGPAGCG
jgi:hypothetical protein